ncbi:MAG: hypothetical protein AB7G37_13130 [Solirubrobacteraceae bacterium]
MPWSAGSDDRAARVAAALDRLGYVPGAAAFAWAMAEILMVIRHRMNDRVPEVERVEHTTDDFVLLPESAGLVAPSRVVGWLAEPIPGSALAHLVDRGLVDRDHEGR